jgi:hypothetical protein
MKFVKKGCKTTTISKIFYIFAADNIVTGIYEASEYKKGTGSMAGGTTVVRERS